MPEHRSEFVQWLLAQEIQICAGAREMALFILLSMKLVIGSAGVGLCCVHATNHKSDGMEQCTRTYAQQGTTPHLGPDT